MILKDEIIKEFWETQRRNFFKNTPNIFLYYFILRVKEKFSE